MEVPMPLCKINTKDGSRVQRSPCQPTRQMNINWSSLLHYLPVVFTSVSNSGITTTQRTEEVRSAYHCRNGEWAGGRR